MHHVFKLSALCLIAMSPAAALAAPSPANASGQDCAQLREQFQKAVVSRPQSPQRREARYFGNEGHSWCETGHPHRGADDYSHALQILSGTTAS